MRRRHFCLQLAFFPPTAVASPHTLTPAFASRRAPRERPRWLLWSRRCPRRGRSLCLRGIVPPSPKRVVVRRPGPGSFPRRCRRHAGWPWPRCRSFTGSRWPRASCSSWRAPKRLPLFVVAIFSYFSPQRSSGCFLLLSPPSSPPPRPTSRPIVRGVPASLSLGFAICCRFVFEANLATATFPRQQKPGHRASPSENEEAPKTPNQSSPV